VKQSGLVKEDLADLFAKYFNKINFRYGFHASELGKVNLFLKDYQHRRGVRIVLGQIGELYNEINLKG
jgi:hypothetical protein